MEKYPVQVQQPAPQTYNPVIVVAQPTGVPSGINDPNEVGTWAVDVCESGNFCTCLYSFCCGCCALGDIKAGLDGSNWCIGCCCFNAASLRFLIRTAYNIPGNAHWDCWTGSFCSCCVINQMLQTVKVRGRPKIPQVGPEFLLNSRAGFQQRPCDQICYDAAYALFCNPCAQGLNLQTAGVPWWFGCLCFSAFGANSVLRYHNRTKPYLGEECYIDCCIPAIFVMLNNFTYGASQPMVGWAYTFGNLVEENQRNGRTCGYGLDAITCLSWCCNWLFTCKCEQEEGRYLHKSTPVIY